MPPSTGQKFYFTWYLNRLRPRLFCVLISSLINMPKCQDVPLHMVSYCSILNKRVFDALQTLIMPHHTALGCGRLRWGARHNGNIPISHSIKKCFSINILLSLVLWLLSAVLYMYCTYNYFHFGASNLLKWRPKQTWIVNNVIGKFPEI